MENIHILQITWFFIIGFLLAGYSVLDGFDLGIGSLLPFLADDEASTGRILETIAPVWDGNEVWLITAGAALFASFPDTYATVFSGFYLALMIVVFALIFRAVSIEFWFMDTGNRRIWKTAFIAGSFLPSLLFGVAMGNLIIGIPMDSSMNFTGSFLTLLRPFPISTGLLGLGAIMMQGAAYTLMKNDGLIREKCRYVIKKVWLYYVLSYILSMIFTFVYMPYLMRNSIAWLASILFVISVILIKFSINRNKYRSGFIMSSISFICLWLIAAAVQFPVLVRSINDKGIDLTIYNTSSGGLTLKIMLIIALLGMPLVIGYTIYVYKIFSKRAEEK